MGLSHTRALPPTPPIWRVNTPMGRGWRECEGVNLARWLTIPLMNPPMVTPPRLLATLYAPLAHVAFVAPTWPRIPSRPWVALNATGGDWGGDWGAEQYEMQLALGGAARRCDGIR